MPDSTINPIYPAIGSVVAAAITAIYGAWRLIGDKETKVSEFRKSWIETFRSKLSEFTAAGHIIIGRISIITTDSEKNDTANSGTQTNWRHRIISLFRDGEEEKNNKKTPYDRELQSELVPHWTNLRTAYNSIILHLNPKEQIALAAAEQFVQKLESEDDNSRKSIANKCQDSDSSYEAYLKAILALAKKFSDADDHTKKHEVNPQKIDIEAKFLDELSPEQKSNIEQISEIKCKAADALLLSMFATKKLLEAKKYEVVYQRRHEIELGITIIDSAGSKVIKRVWQEIKDGEPRYNLILTLSLKIAPVILLLAVAIFFLIHQKNDAEKPLAETNEQSIACKIHYLYNPIFKSGVTNSVAQLTDSKPHECIYNMHY